MKSFSILVLLATGLACSSALIPVSFDYGKSLEKSHKALERAAGKKYQGDCMWENIPFEIRRCGGPV